MPIDRSRSFRIPLSEPEHQKLRELAEHEGIVATTLVREFIKREHRRVFGAPAPVVAKKKGGK